MPKIKTHKSTAKRFRVSGSGKILRMKQGRGHLKRKKLPKLKADYRDTTVVESPAFAGRVRRLAPYLDK